MGSPRPDKFKQEYVFTKLKKKLAFTGPLPHIQKSKNSNEYLDMLEQEDKDKIYQLYELDFLRFHYKKL